MDQMRFFSSSDDPRNCAAVGVGTITARGSSVTQVCVALFRQRGDLEAAAVHGCTPAEARQMAMELWNFAEKADRAMNAAVTVEGKEGN